MHLDFRKKEANGAVQAVGQKLEEVKPSRLRVSVVRLVTDGAGRQASLATPCVSRMGQLLARTTSEHHAAASGSRHRLHPQPWARSPRKPHKGDGPTPLGEGACRPLCLPGHLVHPLSPRWSVFFPCFYKEWDLQFSVLRRLKFKLLVEVLQLFQVENALDTFTCHM